MLACTTITEGYSLSINHSHWLNFLVTVCSEIHLAVGERWGMAFAHPTSRPIIIVCTIPFFETVSYQPNAQALSKNTIEKMGRK